MQSSKCYDKGSDERVKILTSPCIVSLCVNDKCCGFTCLRRDIAPASTLASPGERHLESAWTVVSVLSGSRVPDFPLPFVFPCCFSQSLAGTLIRLFFLFFSFCFWKDHQSDSSAIRMEDRSVHGVLLRLGGSNTWIKDAKKV